MNSSWEYASCISQVPDLRTSKRKSSWHLWNRGSAKGKGDKYKRILIKMQGCLNWAITSFSSSDMFKSVSYLKQWPIQKENSHECTVVHVLLSHSTLVDSNILHANNLQVLNSTRIIVLHNIKLITSPVWWQFEFTSSRRQFPRLE